MHRLWIVLLAACGGSSATPDASIDDAAFDAIDSAIDAGVDSPADAAGCGTLIDSDVYVDKASTATPMGTQACPFHTILEALALPAPAATRTIHVATGAYAETAIVPIPASITLDGAGEALVTISGGGTCAITASSCTVQLGGTLRHVTVTNAAGDAVVVTAPSAIDHVTVTAKRFGFTIRANTTLDHVTAKNNLQDGLNAKMAAVTVTNSVFENNSDNGLDIDQGATLSFDTGMLTKNLDAIFLHNGTSFTPLSHTLSNLQLVQNLGFGVYCASNASCKLRNTTMFGNEIGVVFDVGTTNVLDIGTQASAGNNAFAGMNATDKNIRSGLCFQQSGAAQNVSVEGNTWRGCPPPAKKIGPFCRSNNTYSDITYVPAVTTSGSPVIPPAACTAAP